MRPDGAQSRGSSQPVSSVPEVPPGARTGLSFTLWAVMTAAPQRRWADACLEVHSLLHWMALPVPLSLSCFSTVSGAAAMWGRGPARLWGPAER